MFMTIATPMTVRKMTGSNHECEVRPRITMTMSTATSMMKMISAGRGALRARCVHGVARERHLRCARALRRRARLVKRRHGLAGVHHQLEHVAIVRRPRGHRALVLHSKRLLRVRDSSQPYDLVDPVDARQIARQLPGLRLVDTLDEQARVGDAAVESRLHLVERLHGRRVGRQVVGHAVVHFTDGMHSTHATAASANTIATILRCRRNASQNLITSPRPPLKPNECFT